MTAMMTTSCRDKRQRRDEAAGHQKFMPHCTHLVVFVVLPFLAPFLVIHHHPHHHRLAVRCKTMMVMMMMYCRNRRCQMPMDADGEACDLRRD
jgi:hypothetical protein